jgi:hypothetical protein
MSRYIDADEFGRCLQNYRHYVDSGRFNAIQTEVNQVLDCIEYEIEDTPSIDIIRCRECKYWNMVSNGCMRNPSVEGWQADDFCSYGQKGDENVETD